MYISFSGWHGAVAFLAFVSHLATAKPQLFDLSDTTIPVLKRLGHECGGKQTGKGHLASRQDCATACRGTSLLIIYTATPVGGHAAKPTAKRQFAVASVKTPAVTSVTKSFTQATTFTSSHPTEMPLWQNV